MKIIIVVFCFLQIYFYRSVAQTIPPEQDCTGALVVSSALDTFQNYVGFGHTQELTYPSNTSCLSGGEENSVWITFSICDTGHCTFEIIPDTGWNDLDWALYDFTNHTCADVIDSSNELRCNYSAIPGPTGLASPYVDVTSDAGGWNQCAPLITFAGQRLLLVVNNNVDIGGFTLKFTGSSLPCNQTGIHAPNQNEQVSIYPNPSDGNIELKNLPQSEQYEIEVVDVMGSKVYQEVVQNSSNAKKLQLNIPDGFYELRIWQDKKLYATQKLIIAK